MTNNATAAPARTAARRYSEQLHVLVDEQTRAYVLGLATLRAEAGGYERPKEGEEVRDLLDEAIAKRYKDDRSGYNRAVAQGYKVLEKRRADLAARAGGDSAKVAAVVASQA